MLKIVIDTNVLVSALIQKSYPFKILSEVFQNPEFEICISEELFKEYLAVLNRKKFRQFTDFETNAQALLLDIESFATKYQPENKVGLIEDEPDNRLLELAEKAKADFLITGNHRDFTMKIYNTTQIVSPKEFWELNF